MQPVSIRAANNATGMEDTTRCFDETGRILENSPREKCQRRGLLYLVAKLNRNGVTDMLGKGRIYLSIDVSDAPSE